MIKLGKSRWWLQIISLSSPDWKGVVLIFMLSMVGACLQLLAPWPFKLIVDYIFTGKPLPEELDWLNRLPEIGSKNALLTWLIISTVVIFVVRKCFEVIVAFVKTTVSSRMKNRLGTKLFDHLQRVSLITHSQKPAGDLIRRVTKDSTCISKLIMGIFLPLVTSFFTFVIIFFCNVENEPCADFNCHVRDSFSSGSDEVFY